MRLQLHVQPDAVSFGGIAMEEIPSLEGIHQGYFANIFFREYWYHTTQPGAGSWHNVDPDNFLAVDDVCLSGVLPLEKANGDMTYDLNEGCWSDGLLEWEIKLGWAKKDPEAGSTPTKEMSVLYNQTFSVTGEGTLTISKFQHNVERGTNNVIRLDGIVQDLNQLHQYEEIGGNE